MPHRRVLTFAEEKRWLLRRALRGRRRADGARNSAARRAAKLHCTPVWADHKAIARVYDLARHLSTLTGIPHHVDHIVPLQSKIVCGLHVRANLIVIQAAANCSKGNRWWPDMP